MYKVGQKISRQEVREKLSMYVAGDMEDHGIEDARFLGWNGVDGDNRLVHLDVGGYDVVVTTGNPIYEQNCVGTEWDDLLAEIY